VAIKQKTEHVCGGGERNNNRMKKYDVLLAANRTGLLEEIKKHPSLRLKHVFAVEDSMLHRQLAEEKPSLIQPGRHAEFLEEVSTQDFDLFISNGCPVIIPVSKLQKSHQHFLNVHPSLLPEFRGYHPANGALLHGAKEAGATLHEMADLVDRGAIVHQERFPITPDLDLALLYHLLFATEARVFTHGITKLIEHAFSLPRTQQEGEPSYYRRAPEDMRVDFATMADAEILRRIRAFGIRSQGVCCTLGNKPLILFEAQPLHNPLLLELHADKAPGTVVLRHEDTLVVRSRESLIKVSKFT
jgi:methionyl-tRNA formyltransferase